MAPWTTTRKRRRDTPPPVPTATVGLLVVLALCVLGWQALRVYNGVPLRDYSTVYASTPEVGNLLSHDQVRIAGARVGQVLDRDLGPDGRPRLELQIEPGTELAADTRVAVRGAGLLGARYIELIPGRSKRQLADGATIKGDTDSFTFGLPETLDTFDEQTRGGLGTMLGGLGQGLLGNGEVANDAIVAAGTYARPFGEFAREVLRRDGAAQRLIPGLDAAMAPLDADRKPLARLAGITADAVEPFVDRRPALRETLDEAPPALAAMRPGLQAGARLVSSVNRASTEAQALLPPAPAGLRSLSALLRESGVPLRRTADVLDAAEPAIPGALKITDALSPVLNPAKDILDDLSPTLGHIGRYQCDIVNFGLTMRSMTGFTQPGSGPNGPSQAFRLQVIMPLTGSALGLKNTLPYDGTRRGVVAPCTYLAKPYPQFADGDG